MPIPLKPIEAVKAHGMDCFICGTELIYQAQSTDYTCQECGRSQQSHVTCAHGHFICDDCHAFGALSPLKQMLEQSDSTDPITLLQLAYRLPKVSLHGPEHHTMLPWVLLTAMRNAGADLDYPAVLQEAYKRSRQVPGGSCGYWGICGAAAGAGIFASIVTGSNPLSASAWSKPPALTGAILTRLSEIGGVRCCKRTTRVAAELARQFIAQEFDIHLGHSSPVCEYSHINRECLGLRCPYFK